MRSAPSFSTLAAKAEMKNAKIDYAVSLTGETFVKLHGDTSINASFSFSFSTLVAKYTHGIPFSSTAN